jgi:hypothetical protein
MGTNSEEPPAAPDRSEEPAAARDGSEEPAAARDGSEEPAAARDRSEEPADRGEASGAEPGEIDLQAAGLSRSDASELADLRFHWDEAYTISWADGVYRAARMSQPSVVLTADTCHELRQQIRDDYATWQSSRLCEGSSL